MKTKIPFTICLLLFGTMALQAQTLKPFKADNGKFGYKDDKGKIIRQPVFWYGAEFSEGLANVGIGEYPNIKFGYISTSGKTVIPFIYLETANFSEGLAGVLREDGMWGFIDKTGKEVIPFIYENAHGFKNGKAKVTLSGREFYIDKTGKEITANTPKGNNNASTASATLPQQFYSQFKTLLTANWTDLKSDYKSKKSDEWSDTYYYKCKKTLDGFHTEYYETQEDVFLLGVTAWKTDGNTQLFQQIKVELEKLKAEGYRLDGTESNLVRISKDGNPKAVVQFENTNHIRFEFFKGSRKDTAPEQSGINNSKTNTPVNNKPAPTNTVSYNQLIGVWNVTVKDRKFGLPDNFKIEIKKIINGKAEVWMLNKGKTYKQYKDFQIIKKDNGSLDFVFQFSYDGKTTKKGTGTISSNFNRMEGIQLTPLSGTSIQAEDWTAVKKNGANTPNSKPNNNKPAIENTKKYATVAPPQPAENNFQNEMANAVTSEARGAVLNKYINAVMATSYTDDEKGGLIADKYASVMPVDFHAVHWSMMKTDAKFLTIIVGKVYKLLPADQIKALRDMSQYRIAEYQAKYNNGPVPVWPVNVPQPGQGWKMN